jgi:hypothetical protein
MTKNFVQQAPQMTQMIAPDIASQQVALQRQQQLADLLKQQGMAAPEQTQVISGVAVKQSPLIGLSKMLQAYMGGKMQDDNDAKGLELGKALQGRMGESFNNVWGGGSSQTFEPNGEIAVTQKSMGTPETQARNAAQAAYLSGDMETYRKLLANRFELTPDQKNNMGMGITQDQARAATLAKMQKEGTLEVQPNNTAINLATGERTVGADFKSGIAGGYGANGQPTMNRINGSGAIADMAGDIKGAEARANAAYDLIPLETPNGTIMVTKEQAAQMARQNQQNIPATAPRNQSGAIPPPRQPSSNLTVPPFPSANNNWPQLPSGAPTGTPSQGIQIKTAAEKLADSKRAELGVNKEFDQPKEQFSLSSAIGSIDNSLKQIEYLRKHEGLSHITGTIAGRTPNVSNYATNAQADLDTLKSQIGAQVLNEMRNASKTGGAVGNVTEKEWPILQNQLGALQQAQSTPQFKERLKDVETTLNRVKNAYSTEYTSKYKQPDAPKVRRYNPSTGRIE